MAGARPARPRRTDGGWRLAGYQMAVLLTSACGLALQIVAGRLLAPVAGTALPVATALAAFVLGGVALGHFLGGALAGPAIGFHRGAGRIALALVLAAAFSLGAPLFLDVASPPLLTGWPGGTKGAVVLAGLLFLPPSLMLGMVAPIITKLALEASPHHPGRVVGRLYAAAAAGSLMGAVVTLHGLLAWMGARSTVILLSGLLVLLALVFVAPRRGAAALILALAGGFAAALGGWSWHAGAFVRRCTQESAYACLRVADASAVIGRPSRVMLRDRQAEDIGLRDQPGLIIPSALQFVDAVLRRQVGAGPWSGFVIGGGAYSLPRAWQAEYGARADVTVIDRDAAVARLARRWFWLEPKAGLTLETGDGRVALQALPAARKFNLILQNNIQGTDIEQNTLTIEFDGLVRRHLAPNGIYALSVVDRSRDPRLVFSLVRTLERVFTSVEVWRDADQDKVDHPAYVILASARPIGVDALSSPIGPARLWYRWPPRDLAIRSRIAKIPVLTDDFAPLRRLSPGATPGPELAER